MSAKPLTPGDTCPVCGEEVTAAGPHQSATRPPVAIRRSCWIGKLRAQTPGWLVFHEVTA